ncbi:hypothetical protein [Pseudoramibacter alactolyticus]
MILANGSLESLALAAETSPRHHQKIIWRRKQSEIEKAERENKVRGVIAQHKRIGSKVD